MAEDCLDKISKISKHANGKAAKQTLEIDGESNCLVLQSCNTRVIFKKLSKCKFDDFLYDKDVQHFVH